MIEENNKNKLLIKFNNFDTVNKFFKDLKNLILDNQIENLTQLLAHDIRGIVRLFDNSVDRQEKYIVGLIYYTTLLGKKSSSFNLDLISNCAELYFLNLSVLIFISSFILNCSNCIDANISSNSSKIFINTSSLIIVSFLREEI